MASPDEAAYDGLIARLAAGLADDPDYVDNLDAAHAANADTMARVEEVTRQRTAITRELTQIHGAELAAQIMAHFQPGMTNIHVVTGVWKRAVQRAEAERDAPRLAQEREDALTAEWERFSPIITLAERFAAWARTHDITAGMEVDVSRPVVRKIVTPLWWTLLEVDETTTTTNMEDVNPGDGPGTYAERFSTAPIWKEREHSSTWQVRLFVYPDGSLWTVDCNGTHVPLTRDTVTRLRDPLYARNVARAIARISAASGVAWA